MTILIFIAKLPIKLLFCPIVFLLRFVCFIAYLLVHLSAWILSPVMLLVLGSGIYYAFQASWTNVFLLTLIEMGLFAISFGAFGILDLLNALCEKASDVLYL